MSIIDKVLNKRGINKEDLIPYKKDILDFPTLDKAYNDVLSRFFGGTEEDVRVGVLYDPDVDGLFSGYILTNFLERCGKTKVFTNINPNKQHGITEHTIEWVESVDIEWLFVVDAGSANHKEVEYLTNKGVKVVILDHHEYEPNNINENPNAWLVNVSDYEHLPHLSGCGVTYRFIEKFAKIFGLDVSEYEIYVGVTVISDICDMSDRENRYYVKKAFNNYKCNELFKAFDFYGSYKTFFGFSVIPYLNAKIRIGEERQAIVTVKNMHSLARNKNIISDTIRVKDMQKELIETLREKSKIFRKEGFTLCLRKEKHEYNEFGEKLNFSTINGLVANSLVKEYGASALVLKFNEELGEWRGSFRGLHFGMDTLKEWGFGAAGHNKACGVWVSNELLVKFNKQFELSDDQKTDDLEVDLYINDGELTENDFKEIAIFNEYTGNGLAPITLEYKRGTNTIVSQENKEKFRIYFTKDGQITDFTDSNSKKLKVQPVLSTNSFGYQLIREK